MAKIFKAFQVVIDNNKRTSVPTGQVPPPPEAEEEESPEFKELSAELLAGPARKIKIDKSAMPHPKQSETTEDARSETGEQHDKSHEADHVSHVLPPEFSKLSKSARLNAVASALKRKELELEALEEKLREWEGSLRERESKLVAEHNAFHQEMMTRRSTMEQESAKLIQMAKQSSESITNTARTEAESLKKAALIELELIKEKAHKEGFARGEEKGIIEGEKQGLHEAKLDWNSLMQETEAIIAELQTSRMGILKAAEEEMLKLIIAFAKAVIKTEARVGEEILLKNLDAAINKVADADKIVLRINLKDKAMCEAHKENLLRRLGTVSELRIVEDASLSPGGAKIETGAGTIDASIESQIAELETALLKQLKGAKAFLR